MILKILPVDKRSEINGDEFIISTKYLQHKGFHVYIASNHWEKLYCELDDEIPIGCLKHIRRVCDSVEVKLPFEPSKKIMMLLTELYPDKAGLIRKQYIAGKDLDEVLR